MGEDIILTRNDQPSLLELDEDERALLDGIEISKDKVIEVTAPKRSVTQATPRFRPPPSSQRQRIETTEEHEMDAFINQSKRSGPTQPQKNNIQAHLTSFSQFKPKITSFILFKRI